MTGAARHKERRILGGAVALLLSAAALAGCSSQNTPPTPAVPTPKYGDDKQLRDLYTLLVDALGRHDTAEQVRLTCAEYQGAVQRRGDEDPILAIDFFGPPANR